jgi:hypothetical protein
MGGNLKGESRLAKAVFAFCIVASASLVTTAVLDGAGFYFEGYVGVFGRAAIDWAFLVSFLIALGLTLRAVLTQRHSTLTYAALAMEALAFVLLYGVGVQPHVRDWNFASRLSPRMEVVELAKNGTLVSRQRGPCDCFYADLPKQYSMLSAGGEVLVSHHSGGFSVTFFVARRGMFPDDDYTAFIFRSDNARPQTGEEDTERFTIIQPIRQHWFYVRHT